MDLNPSHPPFRKGGVKDMFNKKQFYILIILILILIGGILGFWLKYDKWPWQREEVSVPQSTETATAQPSGSNAVAKEPREIVMEDVAARIGQLSPEAAVLGGQWYVLRYWLIGGSYSTFYVEYEDGHIMRKLLLTANLSKLPSISYKVNAVFEPGESDWILKTGQDQASALPLILFELDQATGRWTQKN